MTPIIATVFRIILIVKFDVFVFNNLLNVKMYRTKTGKEKIRPNATKRKYVPNASLGNL